MVSLRLAAFLVGVFALTGGLVGQDAGAKKDPPKEAKDAKEAKKDDRATKAKGQLPTYWGQLGLSDEQKQKVYKVQSKYRDELDKLDLKVKEIREKMKREQYEVLSPDQQKRLEEVIKAKAGGKTDK